MLPTRFVGPSGELLDLDSSAVIRWNRSGLGLLYPPLLGQTHKPRKAMDYRRRIVVRYRGFGEYSLTWSFPDAVD